MAIATTPSSLYDEIAQCLVDFGFERRVLVRSTGAPESARPAELIGEEPLPAATRFPSDWVPPQESPAVPSMPAPVVRRESAAPPGRSPFAVAFESRPPVEPVLGPSVPVAAPPATSVVDFLSRVPWAGRAAEPGGRAAEPLAAPTAPGSDLALLLRNVPERDGSVPEAASPAVRKAEETVGEWLSGIGWRGGALAAPALETAPLEASAPPVVAIGLPALSQFGNVDCHEPEPAPADACASHLPAARLDAWFQSVSWSGTSPEPAATTL